MPEETETTPSSTTTLFVITSAIAVVSNAILIKRYIKLRNEKRALEDAVDTLFDVMDMAKEHEESRRLRAIAVNN